MNQLKLNYLPFPIGTLVFSCGNEWYMYVEKALELVNNENFVLFSNDKESRFTIHWVGKLDDYLSNVTRFQEIYRQLTKMFVENSKGC